MASQQFQCSLQDLPVSYPSLWTQPCTDQHLWRMSQLISDWREMAPALGLTRTDEMNIMEYAPHSLPAQRVEMLRTWRHKLGTAATYSRLADAFSVCGKQDLVDAITELVTAAAAESGELPCGDHEVFYACFRTDVAHHGVPLFQTAKMMVTLLDIGLNCCQFYFN